MRAKENNKCKLVIDKAGAWFLTRRGRSLRRAELGMVATTADNVPPVNIPAFDARYTKNE